MAKLESFFLLRGVLHTDKSILDYLSKREMYMRVSATSSDALPGDREIYDICSQCPNLF